MSVLAILGISADSVLIAAGAAGAALVAAVTAQVRLKAQLAHDLVVREREAVRAALDEVIEITTVGITKMNQAADALNHLQGLRSSPDHSAREVNAAVKVVSERMAAIEAYAPEMRAAGYRLNIRIRAKHPLFAALLAAFDHYEDLPDAYVEALSRLTRKDPDLEPSQDLLDALDAFSTEFHGFLRHARAWVADPTVGLLRSPEG